MQLSSMKEGVCSKRNFAAGAISDLVRRVILQLDVLPHQMGSLACTDDVRVIFARPLYAGLQSSLAEISLSNAEFVDHKVHRNETLLTQISITFNQSFPC